MIGKWSPDIIWRWNSKSPCQVNILANWTSHLMPCYWWVLNRQDSWLLVAKAIPLQDFWRKSTTSQRHLFLFLVHIRKASTWLMPYFNHYLTLSTLNVWHCNRERCSRAGWLHKQSSVSSCRSNCSSKPVASAHQRSFILPWSFSMRRAETARATFVWRDHNQ